jgi:hypothetical protein
MTVALVRGERHSYARSGQLAGLDSHDWQREAAGNSYGMTEFPDAGGESPARRDAALENSGDASAAPAEAQAAADELLDAITRLEQVVEDTIARFDASEQADA